MKNWKHFNILAVLAIFGIVIGFAACAKTTKFEGTWIREDERYQLIFNRNKFVLGSNNENPNNKGNFKFTENELQLVTTNVFNGNNWLKMATLSTIKYIFIDDNTFVLNPEGENVGNVYFGTWKKLSE